MYRGGKRDFPGRDINRMGRIQSILCEKKLQKVKLLLLLEIPQNKTSHKCDCIEYKKIIVSCRNNQYYN